MDYIKALQDAIKKLHGCDSTYLESVPVHETFQGKTVWAGEVEVFEIRGHPKAKRCYAWAHKEGGKDEHTRYVAVLEIPPVNSAKAAVQAAIVSDFKSKDRVP
jgi:hypothetical protein